METLLSGRALRDGGFVSLLALTVASVASATLVVFLWSHAAAWLRAWRMLYKLPGPPILIPMAYAVGAQISLGNLSKCMDYNAGERYRPGRFVPLADNVCKVFFFSLFNRKIAFRY